MLLGGGKDCQACGCGGGCPPCNPAEVDFCGAAQDSFVWSPTVNGNATLYSVAVPGGINTTCYSVFSPGGYRYVEIYVPVTGMKTFADVSTDSNGCPYCHFYWPLKARFSHPSSSTFSEWFTYRSYMSFDANSCDTTGGNISFGPWEYDSSSYSFVPTGDCEIEVQDWLDSLTLAGSCTFDGCECP